MLKNNLRNALLFIIISSLSLLSLPHGLWAQEGELGDESWTVEERVGRVFYFTHGTAVWGHEFGFFKDPNDCSVDTLWITFSSSEEKVKDFVGKDVVILLNIDGHDFTIKTPMLNVGTIGFTQVMTFTNVTAEKSLLEAVAKGRYAKVQITGPKELEALMDIKEDEFGLEGFEVSKKEAESKCSAIAPREKKKAADLAHIGYNGSKVN